MGPGDLESSGPCYVTRPWTTMGYGWSRSGHPLLEGTHRPGLSLAVVPSIRIHGNLGVFPLPRIEHPHQYFSTTTRSDILAFRFSEVVEWLGSVLWGLWQSAGGRLGHRDFGGVFFPVCWSI